MKMIQEAQAGTLESSDILVRIIPATSGGISIQLESIVMQQFGDAIRAVVKETLSSLGVTDAQVILDDKGALDCIIRARVQAAAFRAANAENPAQAVAWDSLIKTA